MQQPHRACTLRSFVTGGLATAFLAAAAPYCNMVLRGSYMTQDFSTPGAFFLLFLMAAGVNTIIGRVAPDLALARGELLVVYSMMLVACAITTCGLSEYLLPVMTSWLYFATSENRWAELFHAYLPDLLVLFEPQAVKYFYEGLPEGEAIPYGLWVGPLLVWSSLIVTIYFAMICATVLLRRQWIEHEKLIYPLAVVPLEMVGERGPGRLPPLFGNLIMWLGFLIPFLISTANACHNYFQIFPEIQLSSSVELVPGALHLPFNITFPVLGFAYFINLDIALGLWLFTVLVNVQKALYAVLGVTHSESLDTYSVNPADIAHQEMGALLVLVAYTLWVARGHLGDVWRKAFGRPTELEDADEILPYRTALCGLLLALSFAAWWLYMSGLPFLVAAVFLVTAFTIFLGMTRIVAESGVPEARTPMMPQSFVASGLGTAVLGDAGLTSLGLTFVWATELRIVVMTSVAHGLKLVESVAGPKRPFFWALMLAVVVSMVSSMWAILDLSYTYGGINMNQWFFGGGARAPFESFVVRRLGDPTGPSWANWLSTGIGAAVMAGLMACRHYLIWWPLHPIGFPIGGLWLMDHSWFSIFLAWAIKGVVLKYWGPWGYRLLRPFFMGIILGQFVSAGLWLGIDAATGMTDNRIFSW